MRQVLRAGVRRSILFASAVLMFAMPLAAQTPPPDPPPAPPARPAEADLTVINPTRCISASTSAGNSERG